VVNTSDFRSDTPQVRILSALKVITMNEKLKNLIGKRVVDIDVNYDRGIDCDEYIDSIEFEDGGLVKIQYGTILNIRNKI
jgi:hypothetical protein